MGYNLTPGYEADLSQLLGPEWKTLAKSATTPATRSYMSILETASPSELVAASFILYGVLVLDAGQMTQKKVKRAFSTCDYVLFDVADDMPKARKGFTDLF